MPCEFIRGVKILIEFLWYTKEIALFWIELRALNVILFFVVRTNLIARTAIQTQFEISCCFTNILKHTFDNLKLILE